MNNELLEAIMNLCNVLDDVAYQVEFPHYKCLRKAAERLYNAAEECLHTDPTSGFCIEASLMTKYAPVSLRNALKSLPKSPKTGKPLLVKSG